MKALVRPILVLLVFLCRLSLSNYITLITCLILLATTAGKSLNGSNSCRFTCVWKLDHHHDGVIKWKHFPRYWSFVWGTHRSPMNSPLKSQWRGNLVFSLICAWKKKRSSKQLRRRWFEMSSRSLWRHCKGSVWKMTSRPCDTKPISSPVITYHQIKYIDMMIIYDIQFSNYVKMEKFSFKEILWSVKATLTLIGIINGTNSQLAMKAFSLTLWAKRINILYQILDMWSFSGNPLHWRPFDFYVSECWMLNECTSWKRKKQSGSSTSEYKCARNRKRDFVTWAWNKSRTLIGQNMNAGWIIYRKRGAATH